MTIFDKLSLTLSTIAVCVYIFKANYHEQRNNIPRAILSICWAILFSILCLSISLGS